MNTNTAAFGIYRSPEEAKTAISAFISTGFKSSDISVLFPRNFRNQDLAYQDINSKKDGIMIGAGVGVVVVSAMTFLITGSLNYALLGAVFGAIFGTACGLLVGIGTPERVSKRYAHYLEGGGILLSIHSKDEQHAEQAKNILEKTGAQDISILNEKEAWKDFRKASATL